MKKGFSLSEVLITLGVIGVVSAITMPVLIANVQQNILNNKWKKAYRDINEAYLLVQANEDLTSYFSCTENWCFRPVTDKILAKYITKKKVSNFDGAIAVSQNANIPHYKNVLGEEIGAAHIFQRAYNLNNMLIYEYGYFPAGVSLWVDVNGWESPNTLGKDLFVLRISGRKINPYGQGVKSDWCKGYGSNIYELGNFLQFNGVSNKYYAGIGCSYEVLYGKKK